MIEAENGSVVFSRGSVGVGIEYNRCEANSGCDRKMPKLDCVVAKLHRFTTSQQFHIYNGWQIESQ